MTTNGVTTFTERELPFAHVGFGQDAEWVAASFTNVTEILAMGYTLWVDAQVGSGLENGLYKLTATLADDPPETTWLTVGGCSMAVTNAGAYAFLLEKAVEYQIEISPSDADFSFAAVDDVPTGMGTMSTQSAYEGSYDGRWTEDDGGFELSLEVPVIGGLLRRGGCVWRPSIFVSPAAWQPTLGEPTETFTVTIADIPFWVTPRYHWHTDDADAFTIASPNNATTQITCLFSPEHTYSYGLDVTVSVGDYALSSTFVPHRPEDDPTAFFVSVPTTMFINNDDDNVNGKIDWERPLTAADDDVVSGMIELLPGHPTNGTVCVETISGLVGDFDVPDDETGLYDSKFAGEAIAEGHSWSVVGESKWKQGMWFNPSAVSSHYNGSNVKVTWTPDDGEPQSYRKRFTVVEPIVEPICNSVTNVVEDGVSHCYTVNPCGVAVGKRGYFTIEVRPDDYPDEEIVWTASGAGGVLFPDGDKGRKVTVQGASEGVAEISIQIGDCRSAPPKFTVHVVNEKVVDVRAWLISNKNGDTPFSEGNVRQMVKDASDIYAQVGVRLNLVEPIVVTNIPAAYDAGFSFPANGAWSFDQIVDIATNTGGFECYFINSFVDEPTTLAGNNARGAVLTSDCDGRTLAHELGHAFGMHDIYITNDGDKDCGGQILRAAEYFAKSCAQSDWNGGCDGQDRPGSRYYESGTTLAKAIRRLVMFGTSGLDDSRDISAGNVKGVYYNRIGTVKEWGVGDVGVGFFNRTINTLHQ